MEKNVKVVVIPSIFSKKKIKELQNNIKINLKNQDLKIDGIVVDQDFIVIDSHDPVLTCSIISEMFGIEKILIAKQIESDLQTIVRTVSNVGKELILSGERFVVQVYGNPNGFTTKDVEIAATSQIIENTHKNNIKPGTLDSHDKILESYISLKNTFVSIFSDNGISGLPYNSQKEKVICCIFDELSALACYETIRQGFDAKIIICYRNENDLLKITKILYRILPKIIHDEINLEFYKMGVKTRGVKNYFTLFYNSIILTSKIIASNKEIKKMVLPLTTLIHTNNVVDTLIQIIIDKQLIPYLPLIGLQDEIRRKGKDIGIDDFRFLENQQGNDVYLSNLITENISSKKNGSIKEKREDITEKTDQNIRKITIKTNSNNLHDILDLVLDH